jgi:hypothetical protein
MVVGSWRSCRQNNDKTGKGLGRPATTAPGKGLCPLVSPQQKSECRSSKSETNSNDKISKQKPTALTMPVASRFE